jgi:hypothetical protein
LDFPKQTSVILGTAGEWSETRDSYEDLLPPSENVRHIGIDDVFNNFDNKLAKVYGLGM